MYSGKMISFKICSLTIMLLVIFLDVISYFIFRVFPYSSLFVIFSYVLCCLCNWPYGCYASSLIVEN